MQALLITAAVVLIGQVADGGANRYRSEGTVAQQPSARQPLDLQRVWSNDPPPKNAQLLRGQAPSAILPQQSAGQSSLEQPVAQTEYRSRSQQQPAGGYSKAVHQPAQPRQLATSTGSKNTEPKKAKPSQLIRSLLKSPKADGLVGTPLRLAEAVQLAGSRSEQTRRIEAYWDLSAETANYYMALREAIAFQVLQEGVLQPSADWEQARQALNLRGREARRSVLAAQVRLQRMLGQAASDLPIASDFPHCGAYDTRFDEIFRGRLTSSGAEQLHKLLPLEHTNLQQQATLVVEAEQWLNLVSRRRDPKSDGRNLLKAHELLSLRRRSFVESLGNYNVNIARYSEIASPGQVGTQRLVAMLIRTEGGWTRGGVQRASAEEPLSSAASRGSSTRTFANGQWNQPRPAERSILTQPSRN